MPQSLARLPLFRPLTTPISTIGRADAIEGRGSGTVLPGSHSRGSVSARSRGPWLWRSSWSLPVRGSDCVGLVGGWEVRRRRLRTEWQRWRGAGYEGMWGRYGIRGCGPALWERVAGLVCDGCKVWWSRWENLTLRLARVCHETAYVESIFGLCTAYKARWLLFIGKEK